MSAAALATGAVAGQIEDGSLLIAAPIALAAGLVSFVSPCVLPLVPGYLSYVTGMSGVDLGATRTRVARWPGGRVLVGSWLFIAGFALVFVSLGAAFGGLGYALRSHETTLTRVLGVVTILLGLAFAGAFGRLRIANAELRVRRAPALGLAGAPVLGMLFGLGWTPCIGPTLSAVLGLAASTGAAAQRGALLAFVYCLGLGVPFVLVGLAFRRSMAALALVKRHYGVVTGVGGGLLVITGLLEVTGVWGQLVALLQTAFPATPALL